jgi:hypothetical protein
MVFVESIHAILKRFVMQMPTVLDVFSSFCPSLSLKEMKLFLTSKGALHVRTLTYYFLSITDTALTWRGLGFRIPFGPLYDVVLVIVFS